MLFSTLRALLLASTASAHFVLNYPNSLGFDDDNETESPCGGFDVVFNSNSSTVGVDGFQVALLTTHPAAQFLYRGTLDKAAPFNWTNLLPVVDETGVGNFCLPSLKAPSTWANQTGLVQVIMDGPDGILYQCAAVNFAAGANKTIDTSVCMNASVTATVTDNSNFTDTSSSSTTSATSSGLAAQATGSMFVAGLGLAIAGMVAL